MPMHADCLRDRARPSAPAGRACGRTCPGRVREHHPPPSHLCCCHLRYIGPTWLLRQCCCCHHGLCARVHVRVCVRGCLPHEAGLHACMRMDGCLHAVQGYNATVLAYGQTGSGRQCSAGQGAHACDASCIARRARAHRQLVQASRQHACMPCGARRSGRLCMNEW